MRYLAQRTGTWEWLHTDLPLTVSEGPEWALDTYGVLDATVEPEQGLAVAEDGRLLFEEWGTLIHVETGESADRRRWSGIVAESRLRGAAWELRIVEFPGYLANYPLETLIRGVRADPADLFRQVWQDVQGWPHSWIGVTVHGSTPVRIGSDSDDKVAQARATMDARKTTLDNLSKTKNAATTALQDEAATLADEVAQARVQVTAAQAAVNALTEAGAPAGQIATARATVVSRQSLLQAALTAYTNEVNAGKAAARTARTNVDAARTAYQQAQDAYRAAQDQAKADGGAYEIRAEDLVEAKKAVSDLCRASGMEWTTRTRFTDGPPEFEIHVHYPRAGGRRDDLVFEQGINVISELDLATDGDEYANAGIGVGAGEGNAAVRRSISTSSPRLRRPVVVEDKALRTPSAMDAALRYELRRRSGEPYVSSIEVIDHPNAPLFSWQVGDFITVKGHTPHYGEHRGLYRIISWRLKGEHKAVLDLAPASRY